VSLVIPKQSQGSAVFRAVADPTRRALLGLLLGREHSVNELRVRFQNVPAGNLAAFACAAAGLVRARREGRRRMYQLEAKPIGNVYRWALAYKMFFDGAWMK